MFSKSGIFVTSVFLLAILLLAGCPNRTTIADITRDPGHFAGKNVSLAGRVSDSFGALGSGVFEIDDGSGRMWIYSQKYGVPDNGTNVSVTGRIEQGFTFAGRSFAVILRETERRH